MKPLRIFIGVDERQPVAANVAAHSIRTKSSVPVAITLLAQNQLPVRRRGLTSFTYTRYLVPWLCDYQGHALFVDGDTMARADVAKLPWDTEHAVSVVPHTTVEKDGVQVGVQFERPSVMLFNCAKCSMLTPEFIENDKPTSLSTWAESIGELPREWNHLVGYDAPSDQTALAHFTMGIPCFAETRTDEFADEWVAIHKHMNGTVSWESIMGNSVHARWKRK